MYRRGDDDWVTPEIEFAKAASRQTNFIEDGAILDERESLELLNNPKKERTKTFLQKILREEVQEKRERSVG